MALVRKYSTWAWLSITVVMLALFIASSCSRSPVSSSEDGRPGNDPHQLPFHENDSAQAGASDPSGQNQTALSNPGNPSNSMDLPFAVGNSAGRLPVGTLLTVRLQDTLSSAKLSSTRFPGTVKSDSGAFFSAVLEEPIVLNGDTLLARGTIVRGRIESARTSAIKRNRSYVRLALVSIRVDGTELSLQASSLFARGTAGTAAGPVSTALSDSDGENVVQIRKGRLLTFRLTAPVSLPVVDTAHVSKDSPPNRD